VLAQGLGIRLLSPSLMIVLTMSPPVLVRTAGEREVKRKQNRTLPNGRMEEEGSSRRGRGGRASVSGNETFSTRSWRWTLKSPSFVPGPGPSRLVRARRGRVRERVWVI